MKDPILDMCFGNIERIYGQIMDGTYGTEAAEEANASLEFGTFSSWDDTLGQFFSLTNEQLEEQLKNNELCVVAGTKLNNTVSAETVLLVDSDVIDVRAKNIIAINSHLGSAVMNTENLFMYGGELSASHLVASGNVVLGSCRIVENGKAEVIRNVLPLMNPETQKSLRSFLQFIAGAHNSASLDLEFDEVKVPNQMLVFVSPLVRTVVTPDFLDKTPYEFTPDELTNIFKMLVDKDPSAFSVKQLMLFRDIAESYVAETEPLLRSRFLDADTRKELTDGVNFTKKGIDMLNVCIRNSAPSSPISDVQILLDNIQQYINRGMTVDAGCPLPTKGKKVGSAKWISCVLSTYFNPAMSNVQSKDVLMQLAATVEDFRIKLLDHMAKECNFLS